MIMGSYRLREGHRRAFWPAILAVISVTIIITTTQIHPINIKKIITSTDVAWLLVAITAVAGLLTALFWSGWRAYRIDNTLSGVIVETAKTTSLVFIILLGAAMLTAAFRGFGGEELVKNFLTSLPGGFWVQFIIVMAVIFLLGFFLDFIEIAVVVVPIVAPILLADPSANITAVWLGVMIGLNIQTSFLTPPFGFALFYLRGVAPAMVKTISMYKGVIPFIILQLLALVVVAYYPPLVNSLPMRISLTSETAPPPVNPRMQHCIQQYVFANYTTHRGDILAAITTARTLNLDALPNRMQKEISGSFDKAEKVLTLYRNVEKTSATIDAASPAYRPLQRKVRAIQAAIKRLDLEKSELQTQIRQSSGAGAERRKEKLAAAIASIETDMKTLARSIPQQWDGRHKAYTALLHANRKARLLYRRNADTAYEPVQETIARLAAADRLAALRNKITGVYDVLSAQTHKQAVAYVTALLPQIGAVPGARKIRSQLSKVRRALKGRSPDTDKARAQLDKTIATFNAELAWRQRAAAQLLADLRVYEAAIRNTIGLRKQPKLPPEQAVEIAGCMAQHRDISLHF